MITLSDLPPPPQEALIVYVELAEQDVHIFDSALKAFSGIVNPRRDVKLRQGKTYYKNYVAPDLFAEFQEILNTLRSCIPVGDSFVEQP